MPTTIPVIFVVALLYSPKKFPAIIIAEKKSDITKSINIIEINFGVIISSKFENISLIIFFARNLDTTSRRDST